jgi:hypothetical protein
LASASSRPAGRASAFARCGVVPQRRIFDTRVEFFQPVLAVSTSIRWPSSFSDLRMAAIVF